jgi:hypothetical protein
MTVSKALVSIVIVLAIILTLELTGVIGAHPTPPSAPTPVLPVINSFAASPSSISAGGSSTLSWTVTGAKTVSIDQGVGYVTFTTGTKTVSPKSTTIYRLTATNDTGSSSATAQVTVAGGSSAASTDLPVIEYFTASPAVINRGSSSTLSWNASNATSVTIDNGIGSVASSGSIVTSPSATTNYTLQATNRAGWVSQTVKLTVAGGQSSTTPAASSIPSTSYSAKSLTNSQYGFTIYYPSDWVVRQDLLTTPYHIDSVSVNAFIPVETVFAFDADAPESADWITKTYSLTKAQDFKLMSPIANTTLPGGQKAYTYNVKYTSTSGYPVDAYVMDVDRGSKRLRFQVYTIDAFAPYDEVAFSEIAHAVTFK